MSPRCFAAKCEREFDSFEDMVAVPGAGDQSPRHFCEPCSERIRRGPPLTDGGQSPNGTTQSESSDRVKLFPPHLQKPRPIAFRSPSKRSIPGCINPQLSQYNTTLSPPLAILPEGITTGGGKNLARITRTLERSLQPDTDHSEGSSQ